MAAREVARQVSLQSKFKGAVVGAVIGDCLGSPFEGRSVVSMREILTLTDDIENDRVSSLPYTDDTAMTRSVAYSLIEKRQVDVQDLAKRFVSEFYRNPNRGYGASVGNVFSALKEENFSDPHGPASKQFDGSGSYGNGGSMRISPAALFAYNMPDEEMHNIVRAVTKITHTHRDAINGAILQCSAVLRALKETNTRLDSETFLDKLLRKINLVECTDHRDRDEELPRPYLSKINKIVKYISSKKDPTKEEFCHEIGNGISALEAVPAAVYSFVRSSKPMKDIQNRNNFEKTILHSISLGGDTDTIATMSGAIAGAYYGIEAIPEPWRRVCEGAGDALDYAEKLYRLSMANEN